MTLEAAVRETLSRHPELKVGILFGSLARGAARPDSDLDLAVAGARPLSAQDKERCPPSVETLLSDSDLQNIVTPN